MSKYLRALLVIYALGVTAGCLWVPFHHKYPSADRFLGYGWLWIGPAVPSYQQAAQVDVIRLLFTLLAWTALNVAIGCVLGLRRR